jgi:hypothetical protein
VIKLSNLNTNHKINYSKDMKVYLKNNTKSL